jgi:hypothetical protein
MDKDKKIYLILVVIILLIITGIYAYRYFYKETPEEQLMKCIAKNTDMLYLSKTCTFCAKQKQVLGDYLSLFKITDCFYEIEKCKEANIPGYPTWIINGKMYPGEKSIEELKQLTGCECGELNLTINNSETCVEGESCVSAIDSTCTTNLSD